jgi:hypothetical protein
MADDAAAAADMKKRIELNLEKKRLQHTLKGINIEIKEIDVRLYQYLEAAKQIGCVYNGMKIMKDEVCRRKGKRGKEKDQAMRNVLEEYGLSDVDSVIKDLQDCCKGDEMIVPKITLKEVKL